MDSSKTKALKTIIETPAHTGRNSPTRSARQQDRTQRPCVPQERRLRGRCDRKPDHRQTTAQQDGGTPDQFDDR